jgi:L-rhamnose mutarotase
MKKNRRTWIAVAMLILCGGILGFALGTATTREGLARADDAKASRGEDKTSQAAASVPTRTVQRFGSMIGLRPEKKEEYIRLHASAWPEILAILKKCHIRNYSIYLSDIDGKLYLFSYFEYTGGDIAKDAAVMKADPKTREWWTHTDPCQIRLPDTKKGDWWKGIPEVFHMD